MEVVQEDVFTTSEKIATKLFAEEDENSSSLNKENNKKQKREMATIDKLLHRANIDTKDLKPLVQNIYFGETIVSDDLKLFEVDQAMLDYLLEGNSLVIRGNENENAICCSNSSTYSFKVAEISNPLLISTNIVLPDKIKENETRRNTNSEVFLMSNTYYTLTREKPRLAKLKNLLEMNLYFGKATDENSSEDTKKYRINDLLEIIQGSEEEIYTYLNYIEAFQIDGYWRLLDFGLYNKIIDDFLKCIDDNSFSYNKIPIDEIYSDLQCLYSISLLKQIANYFFDRDETSEDSIYKIKKNKLFKFYSESLLRSTLKMNYNEFLLILRKTLPQTFRNDFHIDYIRSISYVEEPYIYYMNCLELPDDIQKRFKFLFDKREKWQASELSALIKDLCKDDTEVNNALTKYCRLYTQNGIKYYTTRL